MADRGASQAARWLTCLLYPERRAEESAIAWLLADPVFVEAAARRAGSLR